MGQKPVEPELFLSQGIPFESMERQTNADAPKKCVDGVFEDQYTTTSDSFQRQHCSKIDQFGFFEMIEGIPAHREV